MESITIVIADDHQFYREGVKQMLLAYPSIVVAGEASSGEAILERAETLQPDVILMDIKMPHFNGIEATRRIVARHPHIRVLVLTMFDDDSVFAAIRAGASGYLLKDATLDDLVRAITAVYHGEAIFSPSIARRLMTFFAQLPTSHDPALFPELTERERAILQLIAQGKNNQAIADALAISPKTVRNYTSNIFSKLHVNDRAQAMVKAREAGLV